MEEELSEGIGFIYEAIRDVQGTIRAIDFKANALLIILVLIVSNIDKIAMSERFVLGLGDSCGARFFWVALGCAAIFFWLLAALFGYLTLGGIYSPGHVVSQQSDISGVFYSPGKFRFPRFSVITGNAVPVALKEHLAAIPLAKQDVLRELSFEHLKLIYIRDLKALRLRYTLEAGFISLVFCIVIWTYAWLAGAGVVGGSR